MSTIFLGELKYIVTDTDSKVKVLLNDHKNGLLKVDTIITMETPSDEVKALAEETNAKVKLFSEIDEAGKNNLKDFVVSVLFYFNLFYILHDILPQFKLWKKPFWGQKIKKSFDVCFLRRFEELKSACTLV